jgi:hypothetical protein
VQRNPFYRQALSALTQKTDAGTKGGSQKFVTHGWQPKGLSHIGQITIPGIFISVLSAMNTPSFAQVDSVTECVLVDRTRELIGRGNFLCQPAGIRSFLI